MRVLGLESNVGSMLYPFLERGHEVVACYDSRGILRPGNFHLNFPNTKIEKNPEGLFKYEDIDVVMCQPSCGNFSQLNRHGTTKCHFPLNYYLKEIKPKFFFIESKLGFEDDYEKLEGYNYHYEFVSNYYYGNTQLKRNRLWIMAVREDIEWQFVSREYKHSNTVESILEDLGPEDRPEIDHIHIYKPMIKNSITGERFTLQEVFDAYKRDNRIFYTAKDGTQKIRIGKKIMKSDWSYIITGGGMLMHWEKMYPLTIRERARIQGFPDTFSFKGLPETTKAKAVGKSMPLEFTRQLVSQLEFPIDMSERTKILASPLKLNRLSDF